MVHSYRYTTNSHFSGQTSCMRHPTNEVPCRPELNTKKDSSLQPLCTTVARGQTFLDQVHCNNQRWDTEFVAFAVGAQVPPKAFLDRREPASVPSSDGRLASLARRALRIASRSYRLHMRTPFVVHGSKKILQ